MKHIALIFVALLLGSCERTPNKGADGYVFGQKQFHRNTVQVNVVTYTQPEFNKQLVKLKLPETTVAFTELTYPYDTCTMHIVDPSISYVPEFVGHEFLHCVYGQWHTNNESRK